MKGITPVILIALSIGIFIYYIRPQYDQIKVLQAEEVRYDEALAAAGQLSSLKNNLVDKYNSFSTTDLRRMQKFLPKQIDDVRLVLDVNTIALENKIELTDIEIQDLSQATNTSGSGRSGSSRIQEPAAPAGVSVLSLSFSFESDYKNFLNFLIDLESSLRVMDVTELTFEESDTSGNYNFSVSLQTYWLK